MTSPDYPFVTLLVVKLQRRTDQNDLEINLAVPILEVVSPYPDLEEESFYLFLPLPQASPQNGKFHETRRIFPDNANTIRTRKARREPEEFTQLTKLPHAARVP